MDKSKELQLRLSELRTEINEFTDETPEETRQEKKREYAATEAEFRGAVIQEEYEAAQERMKAAENTPIEGDTPENKEFNDLYHKVSGARLMLCYAGNQGETLDGAEKEFLEATLGKDYAPGEKRAKLFEFEHAMPWHFFLPDDPDMEVRVDTATTVNAATGVRQTRSILDRVFARTLGEYLGNRKVRMSAGTMQAPYVSAGASLTWVTEGTAVDAGQGTISSETVDPVEGRLRYLIGLTSLKRYPDGQVEGAFRRDARAAIVDGIDEVIVRGNASPNIDGLEEALTTPGNAANVVTALDVLNAYTSRVDDKYAYNMEQVVMAVRPEVYRVALWKQLQDNGDRFLKDEVTNENFRATSKITAPSSNRSNAITYAAMNDRGEWLTPIWEDVGVIPDPYTHSASGQMAITFNVALNNLVLDNSPWKQHNFKHA